MICEVALACQLFAARWAGAEQAVARDMAAVSQCLKRERPCAPPELEFIALVEGVASAPSGHARLGIVNREVNLRIKYKRDEVDTWSSPLETLAAGTGDCEDYAILKYAVLAAAGVPLDKMEIDVVSIPGAIHAVLEVRQEQTLVLDNRTNIMRTK